jgi:chaperonin GroEL
MDKQVNVGQSAINGLLKGVNALAEVVKVTLGPGGRLVVCQTDADGDPFMTKDGVTVARKVVFQDQLINSGARLVLQAASKTVDEVGDGTTTSTLLAQFLINKGVEASKFCPPRKIIEGINKAVEDVETYIKEHSIQDVSKEMLCHIAVTSMNGDQNGILIGETMFELGKYGNLVVEDSLKEGVTIDPIPGMRFQRGYQHELFINDKTTASVDYEDPLLLLCDNKITDIPDNIKELLVRCHEKKRPLIIMCEEMKDAALKYCIYAKKQDVKIAVVKIPGYGHGKINVLEDLGAFVGAEVISAELRGQKLSNVNESHLGGCKRIIITRNHTTIVEGKGNKDLIDERVALMKSKIESTVDKMEREVYKNRLNALISKLAIVGVGGRTQAEQRELKDRVDDACRAVTSAIKDGVIVGGGCALINASTNINIDGHKDIGVRTGAELIFRACSQPFRQMCINSGLSDLDISKIDDKRGYDLISGEFCDMFDRGIIDPASVPINALKNAASIATAFMNTGATITMTGESSQYIPYLSNE